MESKEAGIPLILIMYFDTMNNFTSITITNLKTFAIVCFFVNVEGFKIYKYKFEEVDASMHHSLKVTSEFFF